jgi:hypothetical protein
MSKPLVAAYYFPNYHDDDPRNGQVHGPGWSEWELVKRAEPRFPGHRQPVLPAWGFDSESDPRAMARRIAAAADHGVDAFLFDWYWYDDGPFLQNGLDHGFLQAPNRDRVKFALMWANHNWTDIHPHKRCIPPLLRYPGQVTPATFDTLCGHVLDAYMPRDNYLTLNGCPYFSIYEIGSFVAGYGSVPAARAALDGFRAKAKAAGFPDLHLNAVVWGRPILPGESTPADPARLVTSLGFDSITSYVWIHHWLPGGVATVPYETLLSHYLEYWDNQVHNRFDVPYFPNLTVGWDSSPRTVQSDTWDPALGYPFTPIVTGNTPAAFRAACEIVKSRLPVRGNPGLITVNAWNEWTEGSMLEPSLDYGMGYLDAIRDVFGGGAAT